MTKKIIYLDAVSGISGDMLLGALVDAGVPFELLDRTIASLSIPHLALKRSEVIRAGFRATKIDVELPHEHAHRHLSHIEAIIDQADMSETARALAKKIFRRIAEAEGKVHGRDPQEVHFHEVGAADSIADIIGLSVGFDYLNADTIQCSPIPTGTGTVEIAHGRCSIPAPATAELLTGVPLRGCSIPFELATPTGVAAAVVLASSFGPMPDMTIESIGIGAGGRDLTEQPNILRLLIGTQMEHSLSDSRLWMLETNLDDATGEEIAYAVERLWQLNPRDVYTTPIQMKKQRPGVTISVLIDESGIEAASNILLIETPTLGIRRWRVERTELERRAITIDTPWGPVPGKQSFLPGGRIRFKPEHDAVTRIARENNIPLETVRSACQVENLK